MVKHHLSQQTEKMGKIPTNDGERIQSLYEKIKQQSKYSSTVKKNQEVISVGYHQS